MEKITRKIIEDTEKYSAEKTRLQERILYINELREKLGEEIENTKRIFVERNSPSWFTEPCAVVVRYRVPETCSLNEEGYMVRSDARMLERETPAVWMTGFRMNGVFEIVPEIYFMIKETDGNIRTDVRCRLLDYDDVEIECIEKIDSVE